MNNKLKALFDFQHFADNKRLAKIIEETENQYENVPLTDDELSLVNAAGENFKKISSLIKEDK